MNPRVGIISAGEDHPYGHPSPELLERVENAGVPILRTDRDGLCDRWRALGDFVLRGESAEPDPTNTAESRHSQAPDQDQGQQQYKEANCGLPLMVSLILRGREGSCPRAWQLRR